MHQPDPSQGELSFELLAEIAMGATARVELCRVVDGRLQGELVAVKRLHPHIAEDPDFLDMFRDEVWMTAALRHPHVVEVVGWGQDARGPWFAVEFVRGVSLQRLMKTVFETGERFTERMVVYMARSMCDGLAAAHALRSSDGSHLGLVHRDLTPGNILLGFDGHLKITDFGLAKAKQRLTKTLTGLLKGQPQYMSPEQVYGQPLDGRSDVFALGVVLFELFTGRRPWNAASDLDAMRAITDDDPADLSKLRPKIDRALVEVVNRCLQKQPENRFPSAIELRDRFQEWLDTHGYRSDNHLTLARFVRRNAMRQMRWFERAIADEFVDEARAQRAQQVVAQPIRPGPQTPPVGVVPARPSSPAPEDRTRDDRAISLRATAHAPGPRQEAKTRLKIDEHRDRDPDSIDWGDDGPTLVQKPDAAQEMIALARRKAEAAEASRPSGPRLSSSDDADTERRRRKAPRIADDDSIDDEDSSDIATRVGRPGEVEREIEKHVSAAGEADATIQIGEGSARARALIEQAEGDLGAVAPHDPDVPPLPSGAGGGPPGANDTAATRAITVEDDSRPEELAEHPARSVLNTRPLSTGLDVALDPPMIGALPAPRFPSDPSLSGEGFSTDFGAESLRLSALAQRQRQLAGAAQHAASLATGASLLASAGQQHQALLQLREAQGLADEILGGEVPQGDWDATAGAVLATGFAARQLAQLKRHIRTREGATVLALAVVGLLLVGLLIGAIVW